jgi:hypothetical protein
MGGSFKKGSSRTTVSPPGRALAQMIAQIRHTRH